MKYFLQWLCLIIIKTLFFGGRNYFSFFEPPPNMNCALPLLLLFLDAIGCCQFLNSSLYEIDWCFWLQNMYFLYSYVWEWIEQMKLHKRKNSGNVWPGITEVLILSTEDHGCNTGLLLEHIVRDLYSQKKVVNSLLSTFFS